MAFYIKKRKKVKKYRLFYDICSWYNCKYSLGMDGEIVISNGLEIFRYKKAEEMLKHWLPTLKETNESIYSTGDVEIWYNTWSKEEIEFIEGL